VRQNELVRFYVINMGTTIPYAFHLHSTIFKAYQSGLPSNEPIDAQTIEIGPGNAAIIEARWRWEGNYLFHTHGFQEEHGNMGEIRVVAENDTTVEKVDGRSVSMIDWQYELQKSLQKPVVAEYSDEDLGASPTPAGHGSHGAQDGPVVRIVQGSWDNKQKENYEPLEINAEKGAEITWVNEDVTVHTVTDRSSNAAFDSSIIPQNKEWKFKFDEAGSYEYYCTLHPWMIGEITITE
jgi:plastocyanin